MNHEQFSLREEAMQKIMVADDAQFMRMRLAKLLVEHGYEVVEAEDGEQAVDVYRVSNPSAVLLDITMPNKDGLEALNEIRQFDPHAKVIMLTALGQQAVVLQAMQAGARDFVMKPFDAQRIMKALERVLG
jgi:two-component system chemotaxis response regulator CheY